MCMNWRNVLFRTIVVAVGLQCCVFTGGASQCHILSDNSEGQYFHGFDALSLTNKFTKGCATNGSISTTNNTYKESFIFNVQNNRAADIYLNINGISHRTMNSLPHYTEYEYDFALISKKDVVWVFSDENMPNSSVVYNIYISSGSQVLYHNGLDFRIRKAEKIFHGSHDVLGWFIDNRIFDASKVTSISEFPVERVAIVNVLTGFGKTPHKQGQSKFTKCLRVRDNHVSPIITLKNFKTLLPERVCQSDEPPIQSNRNRAFILDMSYITAKKNNTKSVRFEIVGNKESGDFNGETVVVLRSTEVTRWKIKIVEKLRSNKYLFLMGKYDKLELVDSVPNSRIINQDVDYEVDNFSDLRKSIELSYNCDVISHTKYDLPLDLVFLRLSGQQESSGSTEVANDIYKQLENFCEEGSWDLVVPSSLLKRYHLSENNFKIGNDKSTCDLFSSSDGLEYSLSMCCDEEDGIQKTEVTIILNSASDHFYTASNLETTSQFPYGLVCKPNDMRDDNLNDGINKNLISFSTFDNIRPSTMECTAERLIISIPKSETHHLNVTPIANCKVISYSSDGDDLKYIMINNENDNCGATFGDKSCQLLLPLDNTGKDADREDFVEFFCRDSTLIESVRYQLDVFEDFNMKKRVSFPKAVSVDAGENDAATFHVLVSVISGDPSLSVYISECILWSGATPKVLIKNNCPADESLSFVRHYDGSFKHSQHFIVQMNEFLRNYKNVMLKCEIGSCTTELKGDYCVPTIPPCFHLHGDACSRRDLQSSFNVATMREGHVETGQFYYSSEKNGVPKPPPPNDKPGTKQDADPGLSSPAVITLLVLGCFLVGAGFVCGFWWIDKKSYSRPHNNKRTDSDTSGESGRSRNTGSTKLSDTTLTSLLCSRNRKETASPSSSKDDLELKSLIDSTQSPTSHPQPLTNGTSSSMKKPSEQQFLLKDHHVAVDNVYVVDSTSGFRITAEMPVSSGARTSVPHAKLQTSLSPTTSTTDLSCAVTQKAVALLTPRAGNSSACNTSPSTDRKSHLKHIPPSQAIPSTSNYVLKRPNATLRTDENKFHFDDNSLRFSKDEFDKSKEVDL